MSYYSNSVYKADLEEISTNVVDCDELKGKRILVTGANGLIASCLVDTLMWLNDERNFGIDVYALVRTQEKAESRFVDHLGKSCFHLIIQDVLTPFSNLDCSFDYVIHAACNAHPLAYSKTPVEVFESNIIGTINMLEYMKSHGGGRLVFVSSSEVYGENRNVDSISETDYGYINILNARSCYSESKRAAETLCVSYSKEYGIDSCCVRPGFIFGAPITSDNSRADAQFLRNALNGENIVMKSSGSQLRSYEYVSDAVSAILTVVIKGESSEAYNIASSISSATIREFAEYIASESGVKVVFDIPDEGEKSGYSVISKCILDSSKMEALGWKPTVDMKEGVKRMIMIAKQEVKR